MSAIRETVTSAAGSIPPGYQSKVDDVVSALEAKANEMAEALVAKGVELGAEEGTLRELMVEVGLVEPEPEPEPVQDGEQVPAWAKAIQDDISALKAAARRNGITV